MPQISRSYFLAILIFTSFSFNMIFPAIGFATGIDSLSSTIATHVQIKDSKIQEGDIISFSTGEYKLSTKAYDPAVYGVVVINPAIAFAPEEDKKDNHPVVTVGKVPVRITTKNGIIRKGDLLTTSDIPGVAQKATQPGYIIGTAAEDYTNTKQNGKVLIILQMGGNVAITNMGNNLLQTLRIAFSAPYISPLNALRYIFSVILVALSFFLAIGYFGRVSNTGIEAIGRNPLAGRLIIFGVILHLIMAFSIVAAGVAIAYLILVL